VLVFPWLLTTTPRHRPTRSHRRLAPAKRPAEVVEHPTGLTHSLGRRRLWYDVSGRDCSPPACAARGSNEVAIMTTNTIAEAIAPCSIG
jgi:hypothetical protein